MCGGRQVTPSDTFKRHLHLRASEELPKAVSGEGVGREGSKVSPNLGKSLKNGKVGKGRWTDKRKFMRRE